MTESNRRMADAEKLIMEGRNLRKLNELCDIHKRMSELTQLIIDNYDKVTTLNRKLDSMSSNAYDMIDIAKRNRNKATVILNESINEYNKLVSDNKFTPMKMHLQLLPDKPHPGEQI